MEESNLQNKLVYLTVHFHTWVKDRNPDFNIPMLCRWAKVIKIFDWDSEEGKALLTERLKSDKWKEQDAKDFKFILDIYYPDLIKGEKKGVIAPECVPFLNPTTKKPLFEIVPTGILKQILSTSKFTVSKEKNVSESPNKKS
jgi:hypothetical protein